MLGEKIGEEKGKVIGQRVLASQTGAPTMETSFQAVGTILGVEGTSNGTYTATLQPNGLLFGEGQGLAMGKDGSMASWKGQGIGTIQKDGSIQYRGAVYYQTQSSKWDRLNHVAGVFEYSVDAQGNTHGNIWEWK